MNWGYKIMIVYGVFVSGILFLVYKSSRENIDLVTADYYTQELRYQEKIDESARASRLADPVVVEVISDSLQVSFGNNFRGQTIKGELQLYFQADKKKDIRKDFLITGDRFSLNLPAGNRGLHTVKLSWTVDTTTYYLERKIFL